jgi:O-antigen/teichoic acid export membrane protein
LKPHQKESLSGYRSFDTGLIEERFRPEEGYHAYVGRVARGFGVSSAGQGVGRLLGYATHLAVAWMHGQVQLGFYALGITLVRAANVLSRLGLDNGVVGDTARVRGTIVQSLAVTFALRGLVT